MRDVAVPGLVNKFQARMTERTGRGHRLVSLVYAQGAKTRLAGGYDRTGQLDRTLVNVLWANARAPLRMSAIHSRRGGSIALESVEG